MLSSFSCSYWPSVCLLWGNVCLGLLPFFIWVVCSLLSSMSCLCILETKPLLFASFATIFSHSIGCLLFFMVFFAVQKLVSLIGSHGFILFLLLWETDLRKHILLMSENVLPMFSSRCYSYFL